MRKFNTIAKFRSGAPFVEAYGLLLATLTLGHNGGVPPRTVAVVSAQAGDGATTTVINVGMMMARTGRSCLLIDANLRKPMLHRALGLFDAQGIVDVLGRRARPQELVQETKVPNLSAIPAGKADLAPQALLDPQRLAAMLAELRKNFEFILLDTPPVIRYPDTLMMARAVDGVLLVVPSGLASGRAYQEARRRLERVNAKILGAVLNRVSRQDMAEVSS